MKQGRLVKKLNTICPECEEAHLEIRVVTEGEDIKTEKEYYFCKSCGYQKTRGNRKQRGEEEQ